MGILLRIQLVFCLLAIGLECGNTTITLTNLLKDKHEMFSSLKANIDTAKGLKRFINAVINLQISARKFFDLPGFTNDKAELKSFYRALKGTHDETAGLDLDTGVVSYKLKFSNYFRLQQIYYYLEVKLFNIDRLHKEVRIESLCEEAADYADEVYLGAFPTIQNICSNSILCSKEKYLYPYKCDNNPKCSSQDKEYFYEQELSPACTVLKKCNVEKALPMMAGVFWYQINEMIFQRLCPQKCKGPCDYATTFQKLMRDAQALIMYAESLPPLWNPLWKAFLTQAFTGLTNIEFTGGLLERNKVLMKRAEKLCSVIKFPGACSLVDIKESLFMLKSLENDRHFRAVKDLRNIPKVDLAEMIKLKKDNLQFIEITKEIRILIVKNFESLDMKLRDSTKSFSKYFQGLGKFDEGIARADADFLKGELVKYEKTLGTVQTQLINDLEKGMHYMTGILAANLAAEIAKMAALVVTNSNPLKLLFSSPDLKEMAEQAERIADATSQVVRGSTLLNSLGDLENDTESMSNAFKLNTAQITSLEAFLNKIIKNKTEDIDSDVDRFVQEYGNYKPTRARYLLAKNNALWSAFKDATCDILYGEVSIGGAVLKSIAASQLLCERLEGTLAQFFTLREDIFDFQFQLVDAIGSVAQANKAQRYAKNIKVKDDDSVNAADFVVGYFLSTASLQKACTVYCDVLEYKNFGKPVQPCLTTNTLFTRKNVDGLLSYSNDIAYNEHRRTVYLPTRTEALGDTGVIDLQALARGENVTFKIPNDKDWLLKHEWLYPNDKYMPFIADFKLFLPHKNYDKWSRWHTDITISSVAESLVSVNDKTLPVYLLPKAHVSYRNVYEEGYHSCSSIERKNPYSACNADLPKICDKTTRINTAQTLLPTILSMWSIQADIFQGPKKIEYDAPNPGSNLLLRAEVILKMPTQARRKRALPPPTTSKSACCSGNRYRISLYSHTCVECPKGTTAFLGGLYCQIDDQPK